MPQLETILADCRQPTTNSERLLKILMALPSKPNFSLSNSQRSTLAFQALKRLLRTSEQPMMKEMLSSRTSVELSVTT